MILMIDIIVFDIDMSIVIFLVVVVEVDIEGRITITVHDSLAFGHERELGDFLWSKLVEEDASYSLLYARF